MFIVQGLQDITGKVIIQMAILEDVLEAELLRRRLKKQFPNIYFIIVTFEIAKKNK